MFKYSGPHPDFIPHTRDAREVRECLERFLDMSRKEIVDAPVVKEYNAECARRGWPPCTETLTIRNHRIFTFYNLCRYVLGHESEEDR